MLARTVFAAAVAATVGFAAPAMAGEGSPDISPNSYHRSYSYMTEPDVVWTEPGYSAGFAGSYVVEPDFNTGYAPRRSRIRQNQEYDQRGFNSY
jgi:hypothetical protein